MDSDTYFDLVSSSFVLILSGVVLYLLFQTYRENRNNRDEP